MIVGMMRIKNEARWIERVLRSMLPVCERILVFDDHSTDETPQICETFPEVTLFRSPFEGIDETRDKNYLIAEVEKIAKSGDFIVHIDGDEELAPGSENEIRLLTTLTGPADAFKFKILYLWDRPDQIRVDGLYARYGRPSMFRLRPGARFHSFSGGGFHCGNVPQPQHVANCGVKILHYGYMHKEDRIRKFEFYNAPDKEPIPPAEDGYRHMVVGDLFPASSQFRHAGPLELRSL